MIDIIPSLIIIIIIIVCIARIFGTPLALFLLVPAGCAPTGLTLTLLLFVIVCNTA